MISAVMHLFIDHDSEEEGLPLKHPPIIQHAFSDLSDPSFSELTFDSEEDGAVSQFDLTVLIF